MAPGPWEGFLPPKSIVMKKRPAHGPHLREPLGQDSDNARQEADEPPPASLIFVTDPLSAPENELLARMIQAMGLDPEKTPVLSPAQALQTRYALAIALGEAAAQALLSSSQPLSALRGALQGRVLATYHPGELLKNPQLKKEAWEDLKRATAALGTR